MSNTDTSALDEQADALIIIGFLYGIESDRLSADEVQHRVAGFRHTKGYKEAKQALTSLTKELVAEAKPGTWVDPEDTDDLEWQGYVNGVNDFEQNLLKELEEV